MRILPADHRERRGESVLFVWGDAPFWIVVDPEAARFLDALCAGQSPTAALAGAAAPHPDRAPTQQAPNHLAQLRRAGVAGGRRQRPPRERIESISVNVTNRCPLRCAWCYNGERRPSGPDVSADEMIHALEGVRHWMAPGAMLALLGGEPLLEKEKTLALAAWARKRGLAAVVATNGLLVDADFAARAAALGLDCQVSVDGARRETHEAIRGAGTFEGALAGARTLVGAGAHTLLSMVFHAGSAAEIPDYLRLARSLGVHEARFIAVKQVGRSSAYRVPDLAKVVREVADLVRREPALGRLLGRDFVSVLAGTCQSCSPRQSCGTGAQTLLLDADGTIYPCPSLAGAEMAAGSIRAEPLARIWRQSCRLQQVRRESRLSAREGTCAGCFVRHWCLGGCRGETYAATGRPDAPSVTCRQNRAAVLEMFWTLAAFPDLLRQGPRYC